MQPPIFPVSRAQQWLLCRMHQGETLTRNRGEVRLTHWAGRSPSNPTLNILLARGLIQAVGDTTGEHTLTLTDAGRALAALGEDHYCGDNEASIYKSLHLQFRQATH